MASITFTGYNLGIEVNPAYTPVNNDVQYSYTFTELTWNPAQDTLTDVKLNGTSVGAVVSTGRDFTGTIDITGLTPAQVYAKLALMFASRAYPAGVLAADVAICKNGSNYVFVTTSYGKNISGTRTISGTTTLTLVVSTTGVGPTMVSATGYTYDATSATAFVGSPVSL